MNLLETVMALSAATTPVCLALWLHWMTSWNLFICIAIAFPIGVLTGYVGSAFVIAGIYTLWCHFNGWRLGKNQTTKGEPSDK